MSPVSASTDTPVSDPRDGFFFARAFRGGGYLLKGWGFVGKHPGLFKHCLAPLAINLVVFVGVAIGLYFFYGDLVNLIWAKPASWFARIFWYLLYVFIFLLVMLIVYVAFFVVQAILSAPFNDLLSERVEHLAYGHEPPAFSWPRFTRVLGRTLAHETVKLGIWVGVMLPLFLLNLAIPVLGPLLFLGGGFFVTATFLGYNYMDYCMGRREWELGRKWRTLRANGALSFGFGAAIAGALLVPVLGILCVPMAAVGGTLLFCDLERVGSFADGEVAPKRGAAPPPVL
jgi:CysZ protein